LQFTILTYSFIEAFLISNRSDIFVIFIITLIHFISRFFSWKTGSSAQNSLIYKKMQYLVEKGEKLLQIRVIRNNIGVMEKVKLLEEN